VAWSLALAICLIEAWLDVIPSGLKMRSSMNRSHVVPLALATTSPATV
jgi:hypothetical protein